MPSLVPTNLEVFRNVLRLVSIMVLATIAAVPAIANAANGAKPRTRKRTLAGTSAVAATGLDNSHIRLAWNPVSGAASYRVLRAGVAIGQTAGTTWTDALLWPRTTYSYEVDALSATGTKVAALFGQGQSLALPPGGFPRPFPSTSIWNTPVGSTPVAVSSTAQMAYFLAHSPHPNMTLRDWGVAVSETHSDDASFSVPCTRYSNCTLGALGSFRIPMTAAPDPSDDGYLAVVDPASQHEWDMWQASRSGSSWSASAGAALSTAGNGVAPAGTSSGDAANLPLLAGIVRPEEIAQGHIDHALVFGMPDVSGLGQVCPATHHDGSTSDPNALMEGAHLQLDPSVNVDALKIPTWEKTIARALQQYGMYLRDQGGSLVIYAENPVGRGYDAWAKAGMPSGGSVSLAGIPWSKMRVLSAPACS